MRRIFAICIAAVLVAWCQSPAMANDCNKAEQLFKQAVDSANENKEAVLLRQAIKLCPSHAAALNNLAVLLEDQGKLNQAEELYERSIKAKPGFMAPVAGLGDLEYKRGRFAEAAKYYEKFLAGLGSAQDDDPFQLMRYEEEYKEKLQQAKLKAGIHTSSLNGVVKREYITRGLGGTRPRERLALSSVEFEYDSAKLRQKGKNQLLEMASALNSPELREKSIEIEGHTDTFGDDAYNNKLSLLRAQAVKAFLVQNGVAADRLSVRAMGESNPIVRQGDRNQQAPNRRVEFISVTGKMYMGM